MNFSQWGKHLKVGLAKHSPEILTGLGIGGMFAAMGLAVWKTPKALRLMEERKDELEVEKLPPLETVKTVWKCYLPSAALSVGSTVCLIAAHGENQRRNAALATAYALSESALKDYREKVTETVGPKKAEAVDDAVARDKLSKNPVESREVILTDKGSTLCYDVLSGRYFKSDIEKMRQTVNELNRRMLSEMYISLNDFYYELGLPSIGVGDSLGWCTDRGLIELRFDAQLAADGTPCLVLDYAVAPKYGYQR